MPNVAFSGALLNCELRVYYKNYKINIVVTAKEVPASVEHLTKLIFFRGIKHKKLFACR